MSEEQPVIDYASPEKRGPLTRTLVDCTLRIIVGAVYAVAIIIAVIIVWTCANYLLLTLFPRKL